MFNTDILQRFREKHDCRDMDKALAKPVFIFHVYSKEGNTWEKLEGDYYAATPLEAIQQARCDFGDSLKGMLKAECVDACRFYMDDNGNDRVILDLNVIQLIHRGQFFQAIMPAIDEFSMNVLQRREEMIEKGIL